MPEPHPDHSGSGADTSADTSTDQVSDELSALSELAAAGVEVDGEVQVAESTWVIYGHTSYDGEVIVGEYHEAAEASEVLRAVSRRHADQDGPVP